MIKYLIIALLISGCLPPAPYIPPPANLYIGDSTCAWPHWSITEPPAWKRAGIAGDCKPYRKLMDVKYIPNRQIVFLSLGVNDAGRGVDPEVYGEHLTNLLAATTSTVYCVLPGVNAELLVNELDVEPFRIEMQSRCANVIDPIQYGVKYLADGVHFLDIDNTKLKPAIIERI